MSNWFPFTDYDFYAYLTTGMIVLFSLDYGITGGEIVFRETWSFMHIVFAIAIAYIVGQIVAMPASILLEHGVVRRIFRPPVAVMMKLGKRRLGEKFLGRWIVGRYYEPLPDNLRHVVLRRVAEKLGVSVEALSDPEDIFQVAFPEAYSNPNTKERMEEFRRLYGFSRNITLAGFLSVGAILYRGGSTDNVELYWWAMIVFVVSVMMFGRFLKFYAAYGAEVLRTFASVAGDGKK